MIQEKAISILMADDDDDDCMLVEDAFREVEPGYRFLCLRDGQELINYLHHCATHEESDECAIPDLILLDLNMPKMNGREVLREIKADPRFRKIPVVVLTTSKAERDILLSYDLGANSFITKPISYEELIAALKNLNKYWFQTVSLPLAPN
jgi:CheY-like chemotaxis protein